MFERFTTEARNAIDRAQQHAVPREGSIVTPLHLLLALTEGPLGSLLSSYGIDAQTVRFSADGNATGAIDISDPDALLKAQKHRRRWSAWTRRATSSISENGEGHAAASGADAFGTFGVGAKKALEMSLRESIRVAAREISPECLMLGLLETDDRELTHVFERLHVRLPDLRAELEARISHLAR